MYNSETVYCSLVRPKVEYASQGLSGVESSVIPRVTLLVSRQFKDGQTNLFSKVFILKCLVRLRKLRLLSLEDRRFTAGVVLSYKVINDLIIQLHFAEYK